MVKLMDALEDCDDVQKVYANFDIPDEDPDPVSEYEVSEMQEETPIPEAEPQTEKEEPSPCTPAQTASGGEKAAAKADDKEAEPDDPKGLEDLNQPSA